MLLFDGCLQEQQQLVEARGELSKTSVDPLRTIVLGRCIVGSCLLRSCVGNE
jgi:hypothetical protein